VFERVALVHYHELGLKGRNRSTFERRLRDNLDAALAGLSVGRTQRAASRLVVPILDEAATPEVARRLAALAGVSSVSLAYKTAQVASEYEHAALLALAEEPEAATFRVDARRSNTEFPVSSMELNRTVGDLLRRESGLIVRLKSPDVTVSIEVVQGDVYVYSTKIQGAGGLPSGTAGKVISLLSAGIDSPVATWRIARRGAVVAGVHFSGRPQVSDSSDRLTAELGEVLALTGGLGRIYFVPFGDLQKEIALSCPPDLRVIMYRRLMVVVAEAIAAEEKARALVTGESLGQVASQTLANIAAVDDAASLPVLRPLIGNDKQEIVAEARRIGTFELSTTEADDCCTLFMPRNPETHAKLPVVLSAWAELDVARMTADALAGLTWRDYPCLSYRPPARWPSPELER
jgi:thiamine biosynthesis protein ThiI